MTQSSPIAHCDCATVPPTMPTCRDHHLFDCPVAVAQRVEQIKAGGPEIHAAFERVAESMRDGDTAAVVDALRMESHAQAEAACLRGAWARERAGGSSA